MADPDFTFERLLQEQEGLKAFRNFLESEFATENLDFWVKAKEYRKIEDPQKLLSTFEEIYLEYIDESSNRQINVSFAVTQPLHDLYNKYEQSSEETKLKIITPEVFEEAQKSICRTMATDSYRRFMKTGDYKDMVPVSWVSAFSELDAMFEERERDKKKEVKKTKPKKGKSQARPRKRSSTMKKSSTKDISVSNSVEGSLSANKSNAIKRLSVGVLSSLDIKSKTKSIQTLPASNSKEPLTTTTSSPNTSSSTPSSPPLNGVHSTSSGPLRTDEKQNDNELQHQQDLYSSFMLSYSNSSDRVSKQSSVISLDIEECEFYEESVDYEAENGGEFSSMSESQIILSQEDSCSLILQYLNSLGDSKKTFTFEFLKDFHFLLNSQTQIQNMAIQINKKFFESNRIKDLKIDPKLIPKAMHALLPYCSGTPSSLSPNLNLPPSSSSSSVTSTTSTTSSSSQSFSSSSLSGLVKNQELLDLYQSLLEFFETEIYPKFYYKFSNILSVRKPYRVICETISQWIDSYLNPQQSAEDLALIQSKFVILCNEVLPPIQGEGGTLQVLKDNILIPHQQHPSELSNRMASVCHLKYLFEKSLPSLKHLLYSNSTSATFSDLVYPIISFFTAFFEVLHTPPGDTPHISSQPANSKLRIKYLRKPGVFLGMSLEIPMYWAGVLNRKNWRGQWKKHFCVVSNQSFLEFDSMESEKPSHEIPFNSLCGVSTFREKRCHLLVLTTPTEKTIYQGLSYESLCGYILALDSLNNFFTDEIRNELSFRMVGKTRFSDEHLRSEMAAALSLRNSTLRESFQFQSQSQSISQSLPSQ